MVGDTVKVLFLGMAKNCASTLCESISSLKLLEEHGFSAELWVGENGSTDATRTIIENSLAEGVRRIDLDHIVEERNRLRRMAIGRETLLDTLRLKASAPDYIGVVDLDAPFLAQIDPEALVGAMRVLESSPELFAVSASSTPAYYDLLAFANGKQTFFQLSNEFQKAKWNPIKYWTLFYRHIYPAQEALTLGHDFLCDSAFNGLVIYRASDYLRGSYLSTADDNQLCEHVYFNRSIAQGRKVMVSTHLKLEAPEEHIRIPRAKFALRYLTAFWKAVMRS